MTPWKRTPKTFSAGKSPSCEKTIASTIPSKDDNHDNDDDDDDNDDDDDEEEEDDDDEDEDEDDDDEEEGEGEGEEEEDEDLRGVRWGFFDSSIHRTEHGWISACSCSTTTVMVPCSFWAWPTQLGGQLAKER